MRLAISIYNLLSLSPITRLSVAILLTILFLLHTGLSPSSTWGWLAVIASFLAFIFQRFLICGISLGVIAIWLHAPLPYLQNFNNCIYDARIIKHNYSQRNRGRSIDFDATNIICDGHNIPDQRLKLWDFDKQFITDQNNQYVLQSSLKPIRSRLNFSDFDYEKHLISQGVRLQINNPTIIGTSALKSPLIRLRNSFSASIRNNLSSHNAAIILALVTGNRTALSSNQKNIMQKTGTSHILAISGLHLALLGGIAWILGQWLWAISWRLSERLMPIQAGAVFALLIITYYALLTGFDIPVKRAWIMFSLLIVSWLGMKILSNNALYLAAVIVMFVQPYSVLSVGFYFSFIATFIVLWCVKQKLPILFQIILMQILISITLLPITWFAFGSISLSAFFVNILIIPWLGVWVLPWAVVACLLSLIAPELSDPIWLFVDFSTTALWACIDFFHQLNWAYSPNHTPMLWAVIIAASSIVISLVYKKYWLIFGVIFTFIPFYRSATPSLIMADSRYTSVMLDDGETAIVINPGRKYQHINDAKKWHQIMQKRGLTLGAIVLQDDKLSKISATKWLYKRYPKSTIIKLQNFPFPYASQYCQNIFVGETQLIMTKKDDSCQATILWQGEQIELFTDKNSTIKNVILNGSKMRWHDNHYDTKKIGSLRIGKQEKEFMIESTRQNKKLWRSIENGE
ncbi:MAG: ComEC/Rec2 family competence protein [Gammaproteobacteria bacterium]|nr:ComEC/Rec2 family competence protein [Gammaproteobacteria bacterium]